MKNNPLCRTGNVVVQDFGSEVLVYDLQTNKAFCLNETSALVYRLCDGSRTPAEISVAISAELNVPVSEELVNLALFDLDKNDLLENENTFPVNFSGLSRRDAVKTIGFASMIALPIVSSIVAPNAASAQSGAALAIGQACSPGQCVSGNCRAVTSGPSPACCAAITTRTPAFAPGILPGCYSAADCATLGPQRCCSGSATANPEPGCAATPEPFSCTCNPY
ncbi:MAG: PqqD family protein [Pyrinomonadaceae bacterium]